MKYDSSPFNALRGFWTDVHGVQISPQTFNLNNLSKSTHWNIILSQLITFTMNTNYKGTGWLVTINLLIKN